MLCHVLKINAFIIIFLFTLLTTCIEGLGVIFGRVVYHNGWNIGWTFISYLIPAVLNYIYYLYMKKIVHI